MNFLKFFGLILFFPVFLWAREFPILTGPVVDEVHLLTETQKSSLEQTLRTFHETSKKQIQLVIIDSLEGDNLEEFSIRLAEKWKIGSAKEDNGVILLIVFKDRQMRIEVGGGLEGELTDAESGRIIQEITPFFKNGDYASGISVGLNQISQEIGGDLALEEGSVGETGNTLVTIIVLFFFLVIFSIISFTIKAIRGEVRKKGWKKVLFSSGRSHDSWGSSSGGFSGSSGGGGWSGGGGGFSGGGASGRW